MVLRNVDTNGLENLRNLGEGDIYLLKTISDLRNETQKISLKN